MKSRKPQPASRKKRYYSVRSYSFRPRYFHCENVNRERENDIKRADEFICFSARKKPDERP